MNKTILERRSHGLTGLALAGVLSLSALAGGCSGVPGPDSGPGVMPSKSAEIKTMLSKVVSRNDLQQTVKEGLLALNRGDYREAGEHFEAGLRLEPGNGHLHFLNALSYHLRGLSGDSQMLEFAQAGYLTALKFDESNYMAAYLLGQIHFHKKDYLAAQNRFAYGLFYAPDEPCLLNALAAASYYSQDPETALWAARKAYRLAPENPSSIRNAMFAEASAGQFDETSRLMREYETVTRGGAGKGDPYWTGLKLEQTSARLQDWRRFYVATAGSIFGTPSSDIVTYSSGSNDDDDDDDTDGTGTFSDGDDDSSDRQDGSASARSGGKRKASLPKMTNIDVVIIRTEEVKSQAKGINLLEGLQTTLTGAIGYKYGTSSGSSGTTTTIEKEFSPTLTLKGLEYNLNIFNDEKNKAEILARPSLLATEDVTSKFFSGGVLHVQLSSNIYDGGMEEIDIGITLSVTPKFIDEETLTVDVQADHEFLEMQSENVGFDAFSQTAKTSVQAKAVLKFGETLILSGLSERGEDKSESGVPLLQDIPVVQYLFARKEEVETKKSILILLTPRKPRYANDTLTETDLDKHLDLEKGYTDKLKTAEKIRNTNLNAAISHLSKDSRFYRQFRTGDVELRFFEDEDSLFGAIKRTLGFLYF